jgi:hypothetical protein
LPIFFAKKLAFSHNPMLYFFKKLAVILSKIRQFFSATFSGENIFKIITSKPGEAA